MNTLILGLYDEDFLSAWDDIDEYVSSLNGVNGNDLINAYKNKGGMA